MRQEWFLVSLHGVSASTADSVIRVSLLSSAIGPGEGGRLITVLKICVRSARILAL